MVPVHIYKQNAYVHRTSNDDWAPPYVVITLTLAVSACETAVGLSTMDADVDDDGGWTTTADLANSIGPWRSNSRFCAVIMSNMTYAVDEPGTTTLLAAGIGGADGCCCGCCCCSCCSTGLLSLAAAAAAAAATAIIICLPQ